MTHELFDDIEVPETGFDDVRPQPKKAEPAARREDPHRIPDALSAAAGGEPGPAVPADPDASGAVPEHETEARISFDDVVAPAGVASAHDGADGDIAAAHGREAGAAEHRGTSTHAQLDDLLDDGDLDVESIGEEAQSRSATRRAVLMAGAGTLGLALVAGSTLVVSAMLSGDSSQAPPSWQTEADGAEDSGAYSQVYSESPTFGVTVSGATSWFAAGIGEYADGEFVLHSPADGERVAEVEVGDYDYAVEFTTTEGAEAVGLRTQEGLTAITEDGEVEEFAFDGSLVASGSTPVVFDDTGATRLIDFGSGLVDFSVPNGLSTVAADSGTVYQVDPDEPAVVSVPVEATAAASEAELVAPAESAQFAGFAGVGHGYAAAIWETAAGAHVGVHDVDTGDSQVFLPVDSADVAWRLGRGKDAAVIGDHAVSLRSGELLASGEEVEHVYSTTVVTADDRVIEDGKAYTVDDRLLGADDAAVYVRSVSGEVVAHDRERALS